MEWAPNSRSFLGPAQSNSQPNSPSCSFLREILSSSHHRSSGNPQDPSFFSISLFHVLCLLPNPFFSTSSLQMFSVVRWFLQLHHCVSPSFQCLPIAPPFLTTFTTLDSPKSLCARSRQLRFQLNIFPAPFCTFLFLSQHQLQTPLRITLLTSIFTCHHSSPLSWGTLSNS